jgi:hypothetical protein
MTAVAPRPRILPITAHELACPKPSSSLVILSALCRNSDGN